MPLVPVIAAIDVFTLIIVVISLIGWFIKVIKDQQENAGKGAEGRKRAENRRTEIEEFLDDLANPAPVKRPPVRPNPPEGARPANRKKQKAQRPAAPAATTAPGGNQGDSPRKSSNLGAGLREHVSTYMQSDRVDKEVRKDLQSQIAAAVQADLGARPASATAGIATPPHPLLLLLRDPQGIRQAILVQEILKPPKVMQRNQ